MHKHLNIVAILSIMVFVTGCVTPLSRDGILQTMKAPYKGKSALEHATLWHADWAQDESPLQSGWWTLYEDEELNALIEKAFVQSPNINQIRARLTQANAQSKSARSSLLPSLDFTGERKTYDGNDDPASDFTATGAARYEIDLWGKNRSLWKSNRLLARAAREDIYTATISLTATIAEHWLDIISLHEQEALARKQIAINKSILSLQEKRFEMGTSRALDVLQQRESFARSQSQLPDILSALDQTKNTLAVLLGDVPNDTILVSEKSLPKPLPIPSVGLPSDLIETRPDVVAAWQRLKSAKWAEKSALADRLPSFNLSALYSSSAGKIDSLFDSWLLNLIAGVSAPIIDGGARRAEQLRQKAIGDERFHAYKETVLNAVLETENALTRNLYQGQKVGALKAQLNASYQTLEQAQLSYANGNSTYINVLNSINNTQSLEQELTREKLLLAKERVGLYRALGGRYWAMQKEKDFLK